MTFNNLSEEEKRIIIHKGTEPPHSGVYNNHFDKGIYICKQCDAPLYHSDSKFDSGCGWPAFDEEIPGAIKRLPDADGKRTEIVCATCQAHLGHVFEGENLTQKNTRHCVNSLSLKFSRIAKTDTAIFAAGCFWGVEYFLKKMAGAIHTASGYIGGHVDNPTYKEVCTGNTGHVEAVMVIYNPSVITYEKLVRYFFEIHDFEQINGQGPDIGSQYLSKIFYRDEAQKKAAQKVVDELKAMSYKVATEIKKATTFWKAEPFHQNYYNERGSLPYCHTYRKVF